MRFLTLTHRLTAALLALASLGAACAPSTFSTSPERSFNAPTPMTTSTAATPSLAATRLTTLDVLGVGLSVEMFRQSQAWSEMQKHPKASILPTDVSKYPTDPT